MGAAIAVTAAVAVPAAAKRGGKKKLVLLAVPLLLAALGAGLWFTGILPGLLGTKGDSAEHASPHPGEHRADTKNEHGKDAAAKPGPVFVELPEMVANLNAGGRRASFVKLKARLELARAEDQAAFIAAQPRVVDLFQTFLREMRPEELRGSAGTYRLREELVARANLAAAPAKVLEVLFTELLVQ